jgi:hypothetical protein
MKKNLLGRKIPLEGLIDVLMDLYERGAVYVDVFVSQEEVIDNIMIAVREEYMGPPPNDFREPLTDEILNALI